MLQMELKAIREASDKNNSEKIREIEELKAQVADLKKEIDRITNSSDSQLKDVESLLKQKQAEWDNEKKQIKSIYEDKLRI